MAGSYPDAVSHRMAYDADGTVFWRGDTPAHDALSDEFQINAIVLPVTELTGSAEAAQWNDEETKTIYTEGGPGSLARGFGWVFPEKRDFFGFYALVAHNDQANEVELESSTDSTNGISGDWTLLTGNPVQPGAAANWGVTQSYREFIGLYPSTGTRSVRACFHPGRAADQSAQPMNFKAIHLYGAIADGVNPDRLLFLDDGTGLEFDEVMDWGDIPRGSVHDWEIRLLNNSATLSASSNVFSFESLHLDSQSWYSLRDNASTSTGFSTGLTVDGPISPGSQYPASTSITVRLSIDLDEDLGPQAARLRLFTGDWSV